MCSSVRSVGGCESVYWSLPLRPGVDGRQTREEAEDGRALEGGD